MSLFLFFNDKVCVKSGIKIIFSERENLIYGGLARQLQAWQQHPIEQSPQFFFISIDFVGFFLQHYYLKYP